MRARRRVLGIGIALFAAPLACGNSGAPASGARVDPGSDASVVGATSPDASLDASSSWAVVPGASAGPISLGATYATVKTILGGPGKASGLNHLSFVDWSDRGIEIVFASSSDSVVSDDAMVLAIALKQPGAYSGAAKPGAARAAMEAALGPATDSVNGILYWASGISAQLDAGGTIATAVSVNAPYVPESQAPEMKSSTGPGLAPKTPDPSAITTIDMHLHPGRFGRLPAATKQYLIGTLPAFTQLYAPAALSAAIDPYVPFVGIQAETKFGGADHAVLLAVYTQHTTGWFSNDELEAVLTDPRNKAADGLPWAWGLASIDFFDGYVRADGTVDPTVSTSRLAALSSYFEKRRDLFIGIKLAHAHQAVAFDDDRYLGVYDVAAKYGVPVYLHTGFSPFPGSMTTPAYYDPNGLANAIVNQPNVSFILGHVGQGDASAVEHALSLAQKYPNVYLEISALSRPLLREEDGGAAADGGEPPQYPYVIAQVKARGLVKKTIFGTDGPQYDGMVKGYIDTIRGAMTSAGYSVDEIRSVMSGNFLRVFFGVGP